MYTLKAFIPFRWIKLSVIRLGRAPTKKVLSLGGARLNSPGSLALDPVIENFILSIDSSNPLTILLIKIKSTGMGRQTCA